MAGLMEGKCGLIMGVANNRSIAYGIAKALHGQGAQLAFTYQGEALQRRVEPIAAELGSDMVIPCDVTNEDAMDAVFNVIKSQWGKLDFLVHAIGFSNKEELDGRYLDTTPGNFALTMNISVYSLTALARRAEALMAPGSSILTLTYYGAEKVLPNYNVMGVAKAALEASVRYLAGDYGPRGIRVNALSPGPVRTLAGAGISDARAMLSWQRANAPLRKSVTLEEIGGAALYYLSDLSGGVTGDVHHVDAGYHITSMPVLEGLRAADQGEA